MKSRKATPLFITFEGNEGSGKSLQAQTLYKHLRQLFIATILIHEPGSTPLGDKLNRLLKRSDATAISPLSELLLFNAARIQLVNDVIRPALKNDKVVICDRFADSTVAYQGYGRRLDMETVYAINNTGTGGLLPNLTILLDVPVNEGLARKRGSTSDRFEKENLTFHRRVRQGYLTMAQKEPNRFFIIDGTKDKKTIATTIWNRVAEVLKINIEQVRKK